jgi:hypothetical protein
MIVSFKLETDESLLVPSAVKAIQSYGVHMVVANLLQTRKQRVSLVTVDPADQRTTVRVVERTTTDPLIEFLLTAEVVKDHQVIMKK